MITEKTRLNKSPQDCKLNLKAYKISENYTYGCRRSKSVGYYDREVNQTFFSWNGEGMDVYVGAFHHDDRSFAENKLIAVNNMKGTWDYHNYPVTIQAPDGRMMIFHSRHVSSMYQITAAKPHTIDCDFEKKLISDDECYYPAPVICGKDIYLFYSKNNEMSYPYRTLRYIRSRDNGESWEDPITVIDSQKKDPKKFDEVYLFDAVYTAETERIQLTWVMWGGQRHAYQGRGVYMAYLSLKGNISEYRRTLDLDNSILSVDYRMNGIKIRREYFASFPEHVIAVKISAEQPVLNMFCNLMRRPFDGTHKKIDPSTLAMMGQSGVDGVRYACMLTGKTDGQMRQYADYLYFENASEIVLLLTARTDFYGDDPEAYCKNILSKARQMSFDTLKKHHTVDYHSLFDRVSLWLDGEAAALPTNERIERLKNGEKDNGLLALYFQYGRYLMISSSRPGTMAMNLQGIWNNSYAPAWESNYTININTEMNYWPAEVCRLPECQDPMFDLIERMVPNGKITAREMYGCNGFVAHHCTDLWADTAVEGIVFPSPIWPMGGAWMTLHLWEHYQYTLDKKFLRERAYPVMKEAAQFLWTI